MSNRRYETVDKFEKKTGKESHDWIERVGGSPFFERIGLPFAKYPIDHWPRFTQAFERVNLYPMVITAEPLKND